MIGAVKWPAAAGTLSPVFAGVVSLTIPGLVSPTIPGLVSPTIPGLVSVVSNGLVSPMTAGILITLALFFYSLGVWSERLVRTLKPWHVTAFWTGFAFDVAGTGMMHLVARHPFNLGDVHTLTGQIALWLMLGHAIWATRVLRHGTDAQRNGFHRYSLVVWLIWLIPYIGGMMLGMGRAAG